MTFFRKYWVWLLIAAVLLIGGTVAAPKIILIAQRGKEVVRWPYDAKQGIVYAAVDELASDANCQLDELALAAMISSEHGGDPVIYQQAVACVAVNEAKRRNLSVSQLLLQAKNPDHDGYFGSQADITRMLPNGGHPSDRYASTRQCPRERELQIAQQILRGYISDRTGGAIQFDSPKAQRALFRSGKYSLTDTDVAAKRQNEGKQLVTVAGIDPDTLRFWRLA